MAFSHATTPSNLRVRQCPVSHRNLKPTCDASARPTRRRNSSDELLSLGLEDLLSPQLFDAVSKPGGFFKLECFGGGPHPLFEFGDELGQRSSILELTLNGFRYPRTRAAGAVEIEVRHGQQRTRDILDDGARLDSVLGVELGLDGPAATGLSQRALHGSRHLVGIEDGAAIEVARRPADGLDKRGLGAQESLLIRIEHRHQRDCLWSRWH